MKKCILSALMTAMCLIFNLPALAKDTAEDTAKVAKTQKAALTNQLMEAAQAGDLKKVKDLADKKTDLNVQGEQKLTALMQAAVTGQEVVVDFLLSKKVNLELKNENGDTALAMAVGNEQNAIAAKLIKAGAKVDISCGEDNETLLMCATRTNAIPLIKKILKDAPAELAKKNKSGKKALDLAKEFGTKETIKLLQK